MFFLEVVEEKTIQIILWFVAEPAIALQAG